MNDINQKIRHWSYRRQRLGGQAGTCEEAIRDVIGVYSAHPSGPLSLFARVQSFTEDDFYRLDTDKKALRLPAMRQSVYFLAADSAHLAWRAVIPPASDPIWEKRYSQMGRAISHDRYELWQRQILDLAVTPLAVKAFKEATDVPEEQLKPVLNRLAFAGDLLRVGANSLRSNSISYVATQAWLGKPLPQIEKEEALAWLAGAYLRAFGPARVKDFQWWAGTSLTEAKTAVSAQETIPVQDDLLLLAQDLAEFESFQNPAQDSLIILPRWDCYTMGYAPDGRGRFVSLEMQPHVYGKIGATGGNALGVVLINGLARAAWTSRFKGQQMQVSLKLFEQIDKEMYTQMENQFKEMATLLKAKTVSLEIDPISL